MSDDRMAKMAEKAETGKVLKALFAKMAAADKDPLMVYYHVATALQPDPRDQNIRTCKTCGQPVSVDDRVIDVDKFVTRLSWEMPKGGSTNGETDVD